MQGRVGSGVGVVSPVAAVGGTQTTFQPDQDSTARMVRAAVKRKRAMFARFPDISDDDLVQLILIELAKDLPKYDPAKATWSTFVGRVAGTTLIDAWRARARRADRDAAYAAVALSAPDRAMLGKDAAVLPTEIDDEPTGEKPEPPLAEWLREVCLLAKRTITERRYRQGRRFFNVAQVVAVHLMMEQRGLSLRQCRGMFVDRQDLREAVRFQHVPSHYWFQRAGEVNTDFLSGKTEGKANNGGDDKEQSHESEPDGRAA